MKDSWEERKKALENEYFHKKEQELIEKLKRDTGESIAKEHCKGRCPKCGEMIEPMTFREVPLDSCPGCGGIWLGPNDLKILAEKDHRSWFDLWFRQDDTPSAQGGS